MADEAPPYNLVLHVRENMAHFMNKAQLLTNPEGDNIGVFLNITDWRLLTNQLDHLDDAMGIGRPHATSRHPS